MSIPEFSCENHYSVVDRRGMLEHLLRKSKHSEDCLEAYGPRQRPFIPKFQPPIYALTALRKKQLTIRNLKIHRVKNTQNAQSNVKGENLSQKLEIMFYSPLTLSEPGGGAHISPPPPVMIICCTLRDADMNSKLLDNFS